ncbi:hypothetical protein ACFUJX_07600 [Streptomyces rubiginosohelvolus]|uniref:hypothetical protein n=1 Tax=Streptomyces TaxID=1883 RepID=UPI0009971B73|nr:hypothetical protein [Streptomyces griseus]
MTDLARATAGMDALVEADDRQGGHVRIAEQVLEGRARVVELQTRRARRQPGPCRYPRQGTGPRRRYHSDGPAG